MMTQIVATHSASRAADRTGAAAYPDLGAMLRTRAAERPTANAFCFLEDGDADEHWCTLAALDRRARAIAAALQDLGAAGERVLLLYPPGLEYIGAFFGCLYAGAVAVPAYPPDPLRLGRTLPRLQSIVRDARPTVVLAASVIASVRAAALAGADDLHALTWLATEDCDDGAAAQWRPPDVRPDTLAFLQYTSGSTGDPKGVMQTHANVLHNLALIHDVFRLDLPDTSAVSWLPPYHDMGLVGFILEPIYAGASGVLMSPMAFLQRPLRWLRAIDRYRATITGAPNFAYDLCVRKVTPEQRAGIDLSSLRSAGCAAEPVRAATLERFADAFADCGFRRSAFYPCFGLAEATLMVSGGDVETAPPIVSIRRDALLRHEVVDAEPSAVGAQAFVSCGAPLPGEAVVIVDPATRVPCPANGVGEIWVTGNSIGVGYWDRAEETARLFQARLATGEGPYLRTGDLGFVRDGELFVTGRLKDLIIIRGANHHPEDVECTVERSHAALRPGGGAVFVIDAGGEERLVVVHEVGSHEAANADAIVGAIRQAVAQMHDAAAVAVMLIARGSLPKTSSGKIQRQACRAEFLAETLDVVHAWRAASAR